jgi:hypothetical protein
MDNENINRFTAQVARVQTMADGGLRVVLDFSEVDIKQAGELMQAKKNGAVLEIAAVAVLPERIDPLMKQLQEAGL